MFSIAKESMELLLFVYGLSFFSLGLSVLFLNLKDSEYFYARKIWILGIFAITHAFEDWIGLYMYLHEETSFLSLRYIQSALLLVSYVCLFEFTRFIITRGLTKIQLEKHIFYKLYTPYIAYVLTSIGLLFLVYLHPDISGINAAIRYTYGFWGSFALGIALYYYGESIKSEKNIDRLKLYFKISGIAFIFYAFFSGIVVEKISYFPGNIVNTEVFLDVFHVPVQVFRGICAIIISIASIKTLDIFRFELINRLHNSYNRIKTFSSNAAHQIKTPLTALRLQIHIASKKDLTQKESHEILKSIDNELIDLQNMINNLLILTRMDEANIAKSFMVVHLDTLLLEVFEEFSLIAKAKNIKLNIDKLEIFSIQGEKTLLKILISNLVENAIKFTKENRKVTLSLKEGKIIVSDEGIGIDKNKQNMIFDKFYSTKGYGLGLSMVKQIAKIHKAYVYVDSKKEIGTSIMVKFIKNHSS